MRPCSSVLHLHQKQMHLHETTRLRSLIFVTMKGSITDVRQKLPYYRARAFGVPRGWSLNQTIFRWEDHENIRIFCGQIHRASFKVMISVERMVMTREVPSIKWIPLSYAAESSAFRELCSDKIFNWQHCLRGRKGCSFKQSSSPHQPVMPNYLEIRLGEPGTSSMPTASFVGRTVDLVPQERLLRGC